MTNSGKDIITERYQQENPEGARLVSETSGAGVSKSRQKRSGKSVESVRAAEAGGSAEQKEPRSTKKPSARSGKSSKSAENGEKRTSSPKKREAPEEQGQSVKTPSVMKLVEEQPLSENQVIAAGKSRIPRQLRGIEPLSKLMRREAAQVSAAEKVRSSPEVSRDLTEMVIRANAPEILRRFNACDCERCREELVRRAAAEIPARYIKLPELADLSYDGFSSDDRLLIESLKKTAVSVMIKLMIANKKRNFHDQT